MERDDPEQVAKLEEALAELAAKFERWTAEARADVVRLQEIAELERWFRL